MSSTAEILGYTHTIAVVGCSKDSSKPAGHIPYLLQHRGYRIIPVNPREDEILGERAYPSLLEIPEPVDVVDVFRPAEEAPGIARQAVQVRARALWLQLGITSSEAREIAEAAGLDFVEDTCMGRESARLHMVGTPKVRLSRPA